MIIHTFGQIIYLQSLFCNMNHFLANQKERRDHQLGGGASLYVIKGPVCSIVPMLKYIFFKNNDMLYCANRIQFCKLISLHGITSV